MGLSARRRWPLCLVALGLFSSFIVSPPHQLGFGSDQTNRPGEDALRARVQELYGCLQEGNWAKAEGYLTEDSRDTFRKQPKQQLASFEIKSIKLEKDDSAEVVVLVPTFSPSSPQLNLPQTTHWRLVRGVWYLQIPPPDTNPMAKMYSQQPKNTTPPARPASQDLRFETEWFGLGDIQPGKIVVARFPFTNISKHAAAIGDVVKGCECLRVKEQHKEYKPGESGVLEIEFDPSRLSIQGPQSDQLTVVVRSSPGGGLTNLMLAGMVPAPRD
jgi:hypothetical protein